MQVTQQTMPQYTGRSQSAGAWMAILAFSLVIGLGVMVGAGRFLNVAFPLGACFVGFFLYYQSPILYHGFSWWICLLSPLIRRLVDYRSGFTDPSPILLAPYFVLFATLLTLWQYFPKVYRRDGLPFAFALIGVVYGGAVGFILHPPVSVAVAVLEWITPLLYGFHLMINWRNYPDYCRNLQRIFLWGVLILGSYGIFQYLVAPEWDRFWLINTELVTMGKPVPLGIRVWSTLNSSEPFAAIMSAGLMLLFTNASGLRLPAAIVGYLSFLLCLVRAGWLGWAVGFLSLMTSLKAKAHMRLIATVFALCLCVIPLAFMEPMATTLNARLQTFSDLENDQSASDRQGIYQIFLSSALTNPVGTGIQGLRVDSALLSMLIELGWLGAICYGGGLVVLIMTVFQRLDGTHDIVLLSIRAAILTAVARLPLNVPMLGVSGLVLWGFLGLALAGIKYHRWQTIDLPPVNRGCS